MMKSYTWVVALVVGGVSIIYSPHGYQSVMYIGTFISVFCAYIMTNIDNKDHSQALIISLPVSRRDVINSKYIEGLMYAMAGPILVFLLQFVRIITGSELLPFYPGVIISMAIALLMLAILHPFSLGFGTAVLTTIFFVMFFLFMYPLIYLFIFAQGRGGNAIFAVILFTCVILYGLSYLLSMKIYKEKDI